jgi:hypothetical protein
VKAGGSGVWLRRLAAAIVAATVVLGVLVAREITRGQAALARSDQLFHSGDLLGALHAARDAALFYVPGAPHVDAARERLEAIARGAEAEANLGLARRAWESLRQVDEETAYPGRPPTASGERARAALRRLDAVGGSSRP